MPLVTLREDPMLDVLVFTLADHFIGNCVSSFTAIAARHRMARDQPVHYWSLVQHTKTPDESQSSSKAAEAGVASHAEL